MGLGNTSDTIMGGFKLEMLKFGLYLIVPACTVAYFERPEVFQPIKEDESTSCFQALEKIGMTLMH